MSHQSTYKAKQIPHLKPNFAEKEHNIASEFANNHGMCHYGNVIIKIICFLSFEWLHSFINILF